MAKSTKFFAAELERQSKLAQNNEAEKANASATPAEAPSATPSATATVPSEKEEVIAAEISSSESAYTNATIDEDLSATPAGEDFEDDSSEEDTSEVSISPIKPAAALKRTKTAARAKKDGGNLKKRAARQTDTGSAKTATTIHLDDDMRLHLHILAAKMTHQFGRITVSGIVESAVRDKIYNSYECACGCNFSVAYDDESSVKASICPCCGNKTIRRIKYV